MDDQVVIRAGTAADAQAAARLLQLADVERRGSFPGDAESRARSIRRLASSSTFFCLAEGQEAGEPIGVAAGMAGRAGGGVGDPIPGLCHICMVAVRPGIWGRGLGRRMLRAVLAEARQRGYHRAQLFTQTSNERARRLYESEGFVLTGQVAVDEVGHETLHYLLDDLARSPVGLDERLDR